MTRPLFEVADIVRAQGDRFIHNNFRWIHWAHRKVLRAIARCQSRSCHRIDGIVSPRMSRGARTSMGIGPNSSRAFLRPTFTCRLRREAIAFRFAATREFARQSRPAARSQEERSTHIRNNVRVPT
jgi:hypothetical protein